MMSLTQIHWIRKENGLVDFSFVRHYCQWYREPNIGCVLKLVRFYKTLDLPLYAPVLSHEIFLSLCPSICREDFNAIAAKCYDNTLQDRGAENAYKAISEKYDLILLFKDKWDEPKHRPDISLWNGADIVGICADNIKTLQETLDVEQEWSPSLDRHFSWLGLGLQ